MQLGAGRTIATHPPERATLEVTPPPVISSARVLEFAPIDRDVALSGKTVELAGGRGQGTAPRLAIAADLATGGIRLIHCDDDWNSLAFSEHRSVGEAKRAAEDIYIGVGGKWRVTMFSDADVKAFLNKEDEGLTCSFCGRHPHEYEKLVTGRDGAAICDRCIRSFRDDMAAMPPGS